MQANHQNSNRLVVWSLYDFGISSFSAIIQTFIFATYFVTAVSANKTLGSAQWGLMTAIASIVIALISPLIGAAADQGGHRRVWLAALTVLCIVPTALLWFIKPMPNYALAGMILASLAIIGAETSVLYYNAALPDLAAKEDIGLWSGMGWAFGYFGGVLSLSFAYLAFLSSTPIFQLDPNLEVPVRATFLLCALWVAIFTFPFILSISHQVGKNKSFFQSIHDGVLQLRTTFQHFKQYRNLARFFAANMLYLDALATVFAFGGIYAASTFNMSEKEVLLFGIALNISAGIGAFSFAFIDEYFGAKTTILASLVCLIISSALAITAASATLFWIFGLLLGIFVGPLQASSRTYLAKKAPENVRHQMFGFSVFSGKATAFLGPLCLSWLVFITNSLSIGLSIVILFFAISLIIILFIEKD